MKPAPQFRCWTEIDLSALSANIALLRQHAGGQSGVMAIVKADAYGHGLERVAEALVDQIDWFGVANVGEALRIFDRCEQQKVLILSPLTDAERETAVSHDFSCSISTFEEVDGFAKTAASLGKTAKLHAVADTGMGRMGIRPEQWHSLISAIAEQPNCLLEGAATHFPSADEDPDFTRRQIAQFREMSAGLDCEIHLANSAGIIDFAAEMDFATLIRPGLAMYGVSPQCSTALALQPRADDEIASHPNPLHPAGNDNQLRQHV